MEGREIWLIELRFLPGCNSNLDDFLENKKTSGANCRSLLVIFYFYYESPDAFEILRPLTQGDIYFDCLIPALHCEYNHIPRAFIRNEIGEKVIEPADRLTIDRSDQIASVRAVIGPGYSGRHGQEIDHGQ